MNEERKLISFNKIVGLSNVPNGYMAQRINEHNLSITDYSKWHMLHKPYQNDYPKELLHR